MSNDELSVRDVERLLADPSPEARETTVMKLAAAYVGEKLTEEERRVAEDIFRAITNDTEARVREALSQGIETAVGLPHDLAVALANDINTVALPIIRSCEILTDEDLIAIIAEHNVDKAIAIAERPVVSENVSEALVEFENEAVAMHLVANDNASIPNSALHRALGSFGDNEAFIRVLGARSRVPASISERLVAKISENFQNFLMSDDRLSEEVAADLMLHTREKIVISFSAQSDDAQLWDLVNTLHRRGSLTPSIIIRSICMGDIRFFEAALAVRADLPIHNVIRLVHDAGKNGLEAIYAKAQLPKTLFSAVRAAVDVAQDNELDGGDCDLDRLKRRTIERILTQCGDLGVRFNESDLDYLIGKMANLESVQSEASKVRDPGTT